uniref:2OG-Fe(II) oxygenase family protein n=1 Tax=Flavobacterium sp. TaxID=239 RepID=UPI004047D529
GKKYHDFKFVSMAVLFGDKVEIERDGDVTQKIAPTNRKTVFFKSNELVHEVLETHKPRLSVTGWLRRD